ncbi:hypothetical protein PspLS_02180 [Pyricularia sp. CBS 133598]|nr:hypothetical protein PspLS_02180 [Pyricularia sp. CBS 133598]
MSQTSTQAPAIANGASFFDVEQWAPSHGYHDSMASLLNYIQTKQLSPAKPVRQAAPPQPLQRQRPASKHKAVARKQPSRSKLLTSSKLQHRPLKPNANTSCRRTSITVINRPRILDMPEIQALRHNLHHGRSHGRPPNTTTTSSLMAARDLHAAIESQDLGVVYAMLRSGVDPNLSRGGVVVTSASPGRPSTPTPPPPRRAAAATGVGVTPLHRAFSVGCLEAAMLLVLAGADLEATNAAGETAVVRAVCCEFPDDFVALCYELGAVVDAADRSGRSALHYAAGLVHPDVSCRTVLALTAHGADLDGRDAEGRAPLHAAVTAGRAEVVLQLVGRGADVEAALPGGATPLHLAVLRRNAQIVRVLCEHGVDVNGRGGIGGSGGNPGGDSRGAAPKTPLLYAIETGCTEIVRILLKHGADVNMCSTSDDSATDRNPSNSSTSSKGGTSTPTNPPSPPSQSGSFPLLAAARLGNAAVVDLLLAQNAALGLADAHWQTALHAAAAHNHIDVVKRLMAAGAAAGSMRDDGATPPLLAVRAGHEAVARYLLLGPVPTPAESPAQGEEVGACAPGPTALWHAVDRGHHDIAKLLIVDRGADPLRAVDAWGSTPLHHATRKGLDGLVELVLDRMVEGHDGDQQPRAALGTDISAGDSHSEFTPSSGNQSKAKAVKPPTAQQTTTSKPKQERNSEIGDTREVKKTTKGITSSEKTMKPNPTNSKTTTKEARTSKLYASLLLAAAEGGHLSTLKLLLARRSPASALADLQSAQTAIGDGILAASTAHPEVLRFLLGFKTSDDGCGGAVTGGSSSSIWVTILGRPRRPLLDVNRGNPHGATALHYAALRGHVEGARVLLQKGARQSVVTVEIYEGGLDDYADRRDYRQGTPAGLARQKGFDTLAAMIDKWR